MTNFQVDIVQARGNAYENGLVLGHLVKHNPLVQKMSHIVKEEIAVPEAEVLFQRYAPHLVDEIRGLAALL